jgi:hypothetical protein
MALEAGETVVRRDIHSARVWSAAALVVVDDSPDELVAVRLPGSEWIGAAGYPGHEREQSGFTTGQWELERYRWSATWALFRLQPHRHYNVIELHDPSSHELHCWYVNFERPIRRHDDGRTYDTLDLMLDLVVLPDRTTIWKDEDHWAWARSAGVFDAADVDEVESIRAEVQADARAGRDSFDTTWLDWRPDGLVAPDLSAGWDRPALV